MPGTLDNILNFIIPFAVFIFFGFTIYKGMKEPIDKLIAWIKSLIADKEEEERDPNLWPYEIDYY